MNKEATNKFSKKAYFEIVIKRFLFYAYIILAMLPGYFVIVENLFGLILSLSAFLLYYASNSQKNGLVRRHTWLITFGLAIVCVHVAGTFVPSGQHVWFVLLYLVIVPIVIYVNKEKFSKFMEEYYPDFPWDE